MNSSKIPENGKRFEKFRNNLNFNDHKSTSILCKNRNFLNKGIQNFYLFYSREFRNFSELSQFRNLFVLHPELFKLHTRNFIKVIRK